jgi:hypothetical protein
METVDLKTRLGRPLAQFGIFPKLPHALLDEQYELVRQTVEKAGYDFYFIVTADEICGWKVGEPSPVFRKPTRPILEKYALSPEHVHSARSRYLAILVEGWLGDLDSRWKSGRSQAAPAEQEFRDMGILEQMRAV